MVESQIKEYPKSITKEVVDLLGAPFEKIRWRVQKNQEWNGKTYGVYFAYIDARQAVDRLIEVIGPQNYNFTWAAVDPKSPIVKGRLEILGSVREDVGYPNSADDKEPYKSAVSDALKRCAVQFGLGSFLYSLGTKLIQIDPKTKKPLNAEDLKKLENMFAKPTRVVGQK